MSDIEENSTTDDEDDRGTFEAISNNPSNQSMSIISSNEHLKNFLLNQTPCGICMEVRDIRDMCYSMKCAHAICLICLMRINTSNLCPLCNQVSKCYIMFENVKNSLNISLPDIFTFKIVLKSGLLFDLEEYTYNNTTLIPVIFNDTERACRLIL